MPQGLWGWRSGERPPGAAAPQPPAPPPGSRLRGRASPPHQRPPAQGVARPSPAATGATGRQRSALLTPAWPLPAQPLGPEMGGQAPAEMGLIHAAPSPRQAAIRPSPAGGRALRVRQAWRHAPPNNRRRRSASPRTSDSQRPVAGRSSQGRLPSHARPALASTSPPPADRAAVSVREGRSGKKVADYRKSNGLFHRWCTSTLSPTPRHRKPSQPCSRPRGLRGHLAGHPPRAARSAHHRRQAAPRRLVQMSGAGGCSELLYPHSYDPNRRYPMVVVVPGGPAWATRSAWPNPFFAWTGLSHAGYFVLLPNPRGSYGQGETFAAKFHHANGSSLDSLRQALLTTPTLEVSIVLAREEQTIAFVRDHLKDLRAVVEGETLCPDLGEVLRTAIGSASLAGQLAVHSTRAQHLADGDLPFFQDTRLIMCSPDAVIRHQLHRIERGCAGRSTSL